jgi:E3 ubiquitin-protein ligase RNF13
VWLTKNRRVCPVCKRKVYTIGERRRNRRRQSADSTTDSMSSVDDTTPLIRNQPENQPNHGTFPEGPGNGNAQNVASDDEILGGEQRQGLQRFNPFDRVPNLPPQLVEELGAGVIVEQPESHWQRFKRFFSFNRQPQTDGDDPPLIEEGASDDVDIIIRPNSSRSINSTSGNNILNNNLSGSFREENEMPNNDDDDDEILDARVVRTPKRKRKHRSAPNILTSDQPGTSYDVPSSSITGRLGVVAIPNIQFDPTRPARGNNFI